MTVGELIKDLQEFDPNLKVRYTSCDEEVLDSPAVYFTYEGKGETVVYL